MKIVMISDTHDKLNKISIPSGDLLIHAGDSTMMGTLEQIIKFNEDLERLKHQFTHGIIVIAGNHDWLFQTNNKLARGLITNATYLQDESVIIEGIKIFGSPYTPTFYNWAFNLDRGPPIKEKWDQIPDDTNVLITHGPAYGILDTVGPNIYTSVVQHVGCEELRKKIDTLDNLKLHVSGHIHENHGFLKQGSKTFISASSLNERYQVTNQPIIFNL